jgi:organic hydroperoxide reductase OsmC/OhrA
MLIEKIFCAQVKATAGFSRSEADLLVEKSHRVCPYSNATRGNVSLRLVLA